MDYKREEIRAFAKYIIKRLEAEVLEKGPVKYLVFGHGAIAQDREFLEMAADPSALQRIKAQGRVFYTREEAQWFAMFERAQAMLRSLSDIKANELSSWYDRSRRYFWYLAGDCWQLDSTYAYIPGVVCFEDSEVAHDAFKEMGDQMNDLRPFKGVRGD